MHPAKRKHAVLGALMDKTTAKTPASRLRKRHGRSGEPSLLSAASPSPSRALIQQREAIFSHPYIVALRVLRRIFGLRRRQRLRLFSRFHPLLILFDSAETPFS